MPKQILSLPVGYKNTHQHNHSTNRALNSTANSHFLNITFMQMICRISTALILIFSAEMIMATPGSRGDTPDDAPMRVVNSMRMNMAAAPSASDYPQHYGNSPLLFADMFPVSGDIVINDRDSASMDRYLYRSGNQPDIKIPLNINRYIGDKGKLLEKGLLSKQATIIFPGYDVDSQTSPVLDCDGDEIPDQLHPEVNKVYFNGELIGEMVGDNNSWRMQRFVVDIGLVNFPTTPGETATNELSIAIDTANEYVQLSSGAIGCRVWATEVDWVSLQFEAASPIVLVPGLMGNTASFENSGYIKTIKTETGLPVELVALDFGTSSPSYCAGDGQAMFNQAEVLREKIGDIAKKYGSESVHLIGHSKGGLDARAFAHLVRHTEALVQIRTMSGQPLYAQLAVPSLATHGSPHQGTVLADSIATGIGLFAPFINTLFNDLCALTTYSMEKFNQGYPIPSDLRVFAIGADADQNGNGVMDTPETIGHQISNPLANMWYQINSNERIFLVSEFTEFFISYSKALLLPETLTPPTPLSHRNDGMVTIASATKLEGVVAQSEYGLNHGTILSNSNIQKKVIKEGIVGNLHWRKK